MTITSELDKEEQNGHILEIVESSSSPLPPSPPSSDVNDQITPLLAVSECPPKVNIFSVSYPTRSPSFQGHVEKLVERDDVSVLNQFMSWTWSGSTYSGLITMAFSSIIYSTMELITHFFTVQAIPLFEIALSRCIVILALSVLWLRRNGQPIFGQTNSTNILICRAISGYISLMSFIYCIQMLPQSQAILLSFPVPIMASIAARCILQEKLKIAEIGGLACSSFGVIFIFWSMQSTPERLAKDGESGEHVQKNHHTLAVIFGLVSSIAAGISCCLVRAGAKATDQPVLTVFSFAILAVPASALCTFVFQDFVIPSIYSLFLMIVLGILSFLAETTFARGLQLEKTSRATNIQYLEVALSQLLAMCSSIVLPSFARLVGCSLILISACCTMYLGHAKDDE